MPRTEQENHRLSRYLSHEDGKTRLDKDFHLQDRDSALQEHHLVITPTSTRPHIRITTWMVEFLNRHILDREGTSKQVILQSVE
mmetsp:Transcript_83475/g.132123  ORF Transcript_83475/g.132123 Transcript_83475/m.132123 type:complete len:84 (+) Transcript_83475:135-386(+)